MQLRMKLVGLGLAAVLLATALYAEVPRIMNYQGRLTNSLGVPYSGTKNVTFKIYSGSGVVIWNSGILSLTFADGLFSVKLGESPQPQLPTTNWQTDTLLTLGISVDPEPELTPRVRFTTAGYAFTAKTADMASSIADNSVTSAKIVNGSILFEDLGTNGANEGKVVKYQSGHWSAGTDDIGPTTGWTDAGSIIYNTTLADSVGIGTATPGAKLDVSAPVDQIATRISSSSNDVRLPAVQAINPGQNTALFYNGPLSAWPAWPPCAVYSRVSGKTSGIAGWFETYGSGFAAVDANNGASDSAYGISASAYNGTAAWLQGETGLECSGHGPTAAKFEANAGEFSRTIDARYTGSFVTDHQAVYGYSRPADYYGVGGDFEGGYFGAVGYVNPTGSYSYYGVKGQVAGGTGTNYGLYGLAYGTGENYGIFATSYSGTTNWAGYFEGDVNITGNIVKSGGGFKIDHPSNPANMYLQHSSVSSDEMKDIYDGVAALDVSGKATIQLPNWFEALNADFRYQLTCIGGYAPVYIASKISGNSFTIAGGTPGLEVSWQVTGVRIDKFAQANPMKTELDKGPSKRGRYLHPELYGLGRDMSVTYDPQRSPDVQAKDEAIRQNTAKAAAERISTPAKTETVSSGQ